MPAAGDNFAGYNRASNHLRNAAGGVWGERGFMRADRIKRGQGHGLATTFFTCVAVAFAATQATGQDVDQIYEWLGGGVAFSCADAPVTEQEKCGRTPFAAAGDGRYQWLSLLGASQCEQVPIAEREKFGCAPPPPGSMPADAASLARLEALRSAAAERRAATRALLAFADSAESLSLPAGAPAPSLEIAVARLAEPASFGATPIKVGTVVALLGAPGPDGRRIAHVSGLGLGFLPDAALSPIDGPE